MTNRYPRRLVLRGFGGLAVALPLLEFTSSRAHGATTPPPKRLVTFFDHGGTLTNHTHGVYGYGGFTDGSGKFNDLDAWRPKSTPGQPLVLGEIHKPLADAGLTGDVTVLRGIDNNAAIQQGPEGSGHGISNITMLTCAKWANTGSIKERSLPDAPSIDQVIAARWGAPPGGVASINLFLPADQYGTPYYQGPQLQASQYSNPQTAFNKLFANVAFDGGAGPDPAIVRAQLLRRSVLDGTLKELSRYKNQLTSQDKMLVEAHFDHVRSIEQRLAAATQAPPLSCAKPILTSYNNLPTLSPLMVDIGLAALRCGVTRVLNIEIGDFHMTWDPTPLPFDVGYDIGHSLDHIVSEVGKTGLHPEWRESWQQAMIRNRQFRAQQVARLLKGLKDTPEGAGSLLDNAFFLWTSEFSNGGYHLGTDMPVMVAGHANGLKTGRYINYNSKAATNDFTSQYASSTTNNNLFVSMLNALGFNDTSFGQFARTPGPLPGFA